MELILLANLFYWILQIVSAFKRSESFFHAILDPSCTIARSHFTNLRS